ncbi:MAG TPA: hypothetical protein DD397_06775 [Hyphomonas sp.]|uniref:hypothetical protein n=1 Tax=Hyphomonas sp. TaxID=87 RepID=UPI000E832053|nr:hypothetical protein [Hyphomonas sp.]QDP49081.1 MAG: hypothetical protein Unbinned4811contig1001_26 [Prokaryotic dsDNA virus sp.]HBN92249.1 hypothetical protein [Hyphomonas sp.]|tara:strand:+ start:13892 stop:14686 length:795 start_codon:yes stop_codon:yes gene_type:complete
MPSLGGSGSYGGDDPSGGASRDSGGYGMGGGKQNDSGGDNWRSKLAELQQLDRKAVEELNGFAGGVNAASDVMAGQDPAFSSRFKDFFGVNNPGGFLRSNGGSAAAALGSMINPLLGLSIGGAQLLDAVNYGHPGRIGQVLGEGLLGMGVGGTVGEFGGNLIAGNYSPEDLTPDISLPDFDFGEGGQYYAGSDQNDDPPLLREGPVSTPQPQQTVSAASLPSAVEAARPRQVEFQAKQYGLLGDPTSPEERAWRDQLGYRRYLL